MLTTMTRRGFLAGLLAAALLVPALAGPDGTLHAQGNPNLLTNGGLERPYYGQASATQTAPQGWSLWVGAGSPEAFPHTDRVQVLDGEVSWNLHQGYVAFTTAGYQRVTGVQPGEALEASAYGWAYTCNDTSNSCIIPDPPYRRSDPSAGVSMKVGIDPTGGTDPMAGSVVWSGGAAPYDQWARISVAATAEGDAVTVFLYASQQNGLALNHVYWDQAALVRTSAAAVDAPGAGQEAPFVAPQGVRPDGSIVHTVQEGDTLSSIAFAYADYGVTVQSIAALNEGIEANTRVLTVGQQITILPPGSVEPDSGRPVAADETAHAPEPSGAAQPTDIPITRQAGTSIPTPTPVGQSALAATPALSLVNPLRMWVNRDAPPATEPDPTEEPLAAGAAPSPTVEVTAASSEPTGEGEAVAAVPSSETSAGAGRLCITLYEDANHNLVRDADEIPLSEGLASIADANGAEQGPLDGGAAPWCIELQPGRYTVAAQPPDGYRPTTTDRLSVLVAGGREARVMFGSATDYEPPALPDGEDDLLATAADLERGAAAPIVDIEVGPDPDEDLLDRLYENSGLILLGAAGVVLVGGGAALLLLRRR